MHKSITIQVWFNHVQTVVVASVQIVPIYVEFHFRI